MDRPVKETETAIVRALPKQELLETVQAAAHLGLTPGLFKALRLFRCGPPSLTIQSRLVYRRAELDKLRVVWCAAVHVRAEDRLKITPDPQAMQSAWSVYRSSAEPTGLDPLMRILALRAIRHRIVVSIFWTMAIIGGAITLTLF